ncbi:MAG: cell wall-active antibiotics response protein [Bacteroidales bacterium]|jgi:predicted membrane protein|nr:cell wall-active antibiotics response protein [Bacteroidales bacterium]
MKKQSEPIKTEELNKRIKRRHRIDGIMFALLCIAIGVIFLGRNVGFISPYLFTILISWQMLIVIVGIFFLSYKHYFSGILVVSCGAYFMLPLITGSQDDWASMWPILLMIIGIIIIFRIIFPKRTIPYSQHNMKTDYKTEDGFVLSNNQFGSTQHIVMDEIFKGAEINNKFGATVLDLRRTSFLPGNTYIDINSSFGGIEIYVPNDCLILTEISTSIGGVSDERLNPIINVNEDCKLIIRGRLSASGVVIKS